MLQLRDYQREAVDAILACLTDNDRKWVNPYATLICGSGKSLVAAALAKELLPQRVVVLVPSQTLMQQNYDEAMAYGMSDRDVGVYCADRKDRTKRVIIATYQALARSPKSVGLIAHFVADECHGAMTPSHRKIFDAHPNARITGLTGSPWQMSNGKPVKLERLRDPVFGEEVYNTYKPKFFAEMLKNNNYAHIRNGRPLTLIDTAGMRVKMGEYDEAQLSERAIEQAKTHVTEALSQLEEHQRQHVLWLCTSIAHAKAIEHELKTRGEDVFRVAGDLSKNENLDNIDSFMKKEYRHIISVQQLLVGWNAKHVDALVQLRPTRSLPLHVQSLSRAVRAYPGKAYSLLLDATDNTVRLGPINAPKVDAEDDTLRGYWQCGKPRNVSVAGYTEQDAALPEAQRSVYMPATGRPNLRLIGDVDPYATPCSFLNEPQYAVCCNCGTPRDFVLRKTTRGDNDPRDGDPDLEDDFDARASASAFDDNAQSSNARRELVPVFGHSLTFDPAKDVLTLMLITGKGPLYVPMIFMGDDSMAITKSRQLFQTATGKRHLITSAFKAHLLREHFTSPISVELDDDGAVGRIVWDGRKQWLAAVKEEKSA